jgi:hypothetical protein
MTKNAKFTEQFATLAALAPASVAASTVVTTWVPVQDYHGIVALIDTGVLGASATLDAKLRQATDSSGTGAKDVTGKALVQIVKASGDGKQASIEMRCEDIDTNNSFTHVALSVTIGTAASIFGARLLGVNPRHMPPTNAATVVQTV